MVRKKYDMKLFLLFITICLMPSLGSFSPVAPNSSMADLMVRMNKESILHEKPPSRHYPLKVYPDKMSSEPHGFGFRNMRDFILSLIPKRNNETTVGNKTNARLYYFIFLNPSKSEKALNGQKIEYDNEQTYGNDHKEGEANLNGSWENLRLNGNESFKPQVKKGLVSNGNKKADKVVNYTRSYFLHKPVYNGSGSKDLYYKKQKYGNISLDAKFQSADAFHEMGVTETTKINGKYPEDLESNEKQPDVLKSNTKHQEEFESSGKQHPAAFESNGGRSSIPKLKNESQATVNKKTIETILPSKLVHIEQMHSKLNKEVKSQMKTTRAAEQASRPKQKRQVEGTPEGKSNNNPRGDGNLADKSTCNGPEGDCASPMDPSSNDPKGGGTSTEGNSPRGNSNSSEKSSENVSSDTPDVKAKNSDFKSDSDLPYHSGGYSNERGTIQISYRKPNEMTPDHFKINGNIPDETKVAGETEFGNTGNHPLKGENYSKSTNPVMKHGNHYDMMTKQIPAIIESSTGETEIVNQTLFSNTDENLFNDEKYTKQITDMDSANSTDETTANQKVLNNTGGKNASDGHSKETPNIKIQVQLHEMTTEQVQTLKETSTIDTETIRETTLKPTVHLPLAGEQNANNASYHRMKRRNVNGMMTEKVEEKNGSSIHETKAANQKVLNSTDEKNTADGYLSETTKKIRQLHEIMTGQLQVPDKNSSVETETVIQTKLGHTEDHSKTGEEEVTNPGIRYWQQNVMTTEQLQSVDESSTSETEIANQTLFSNTDENLFNDEKDTKQITDMAIKVLQNETTTKQIQTFYENSRGTEKTVTETKQSHVDNHSTAEEKNKEATLHAVEGHKLNDTMSDHIQAFSANSTDETTANQKVVNTDRKNASDGHSKETPNIKIQVHLHEMTTEQGQTLKETSTVDTETIRETKLKPTVDHPLAGEQNANNASYYRMKRRSLNDTTTEKIEETNDSSIHETKAANGTILSSNDEKNTAGGYPTETTMKITQLHEIMTGEVQVPDKNSSVETETAIQTKLGSTEDHSQTGQEEVTNLRIGHRQQNVMATEQMQIVNENSTDETNSAYQTLERNTGAQTITDESKIFEVKGIARMAIKNRQTFLPSTLPYGKFVEMGKSAKLPIHASNRKLHEMMTGQLQVPDMKSNIETGIGILTKLGRTEDHSQTGEDGVANPGVRHRQQNVMTTEQIKSINPSSAGETGSANTMIRMNTGAQTINDKSKILETSHLLQGIARMANQNGQTFVPSKPPQGIFVEMGNSETLPINASNRKLHEMMSRQFQVPDMKSNIETGIGILTKLGRTEDHSQTGEDGVANPGVRYGQQNVMVTEQIQAVDESNTNETDSVNATVLGNTSVQTINDEGKISGPSYLHDIVRMAHLFRNRQAFVPRTSYEKFVRMGMNVKLPVHTSNRKPARMGMGVM